MATVDELLEHYAQLRSQILDEIAVLRSGDCRLIRNNEEITEAWLQDQQSRADELGSMIAAYEKPLLYVYGAF